MPLIDILLIFAFMAYAIGSGLRARKVASAGPEEYFPRGAYDSGLERRASRWRPRNTRPTRRSS
jgi:hypothetical protein